MDSVSASDTVVNWADSGLSNVTTYYYRIVAVDLAGNTSVLLASLPCADPKTLASSIKHGAPDSVNTTGFINQTSTLCALERIYKRGGSHPLLCDRSNS